MPYRSRIIETVKYGSLPEYLSTIRDLNRIAESRGRVPSQVLTPVVGVSNQVVLETEFPDLTTLEAQINDFWADEEALRVWRSKAAVTVEGETYSELLFEQR
jgi:hypothetical protein